MCTNYKYNGCIDSRRDVESRTSIGTTVRGDVFELTNNDLESLLERNVR
jgi:hypothetical protein